MEEESLNSECFEAASGESDQFTLLLTLQNFEKGKDLCEDIAQGLPASIGSEEEYELVLRFLETSLLNTSAANGIQQNVYIGLFDDSEVPLLVEDNSTDRFNWIDDSDFVFGSVSGVFPWITEEPNNFQPLIDDESVAESTDEACVEIMLDKQTWNDIRCSRLSQILCRRSCINQEVLADIEAGGIGERLVSILAAVSALMVGIVFAVAFVVWKGRLLRHKSTGLMTRLDKFEIDLGYIKNDPSLPTTSLDGGNGRQVPSGLNLPPGNLTGQPRRNWIKDLADTDTIITMRLSAGIESTAGSDTETRDGARDMETKSSINIRNSYYRGSASSALTSNTKTTLGVLRMSVQRNKSEIDFEEPHLKEFEHYVSKPCSESSDNPKRQNNNLSSLRTQRSRQGKTQTNPKAGNGNSRNTPGNVEHVQPDKPRRWMSRSKPKSNFQELTELKRKSQMSHEEQIEVLPSL